MLSPIFQLVKAEPRATISVSPLTVSNNLTRFCVEMNESVAKQSLQKCSFHGNFQVSLDSKFEPDMEFESYLYCKDLRSPIGIEPYVGFPQITYIGPYIGDWNFQPIRN